MVQKSEKMVQKGAKVVQNGAKPVRFGTVRMLQKILKADERGEGRKFGWNGKVENIEQ